MENMNNNKGFTLIELIITVAITAALSITIGLSASMIMKKSKLNKEINNLKDIMNAASIFSELSDNGICTEGSNCNVTISHLVNRGLVDKGIVNEYNPMYVEQKFRLTDTIRITYSSGKKSVRYSCGSYTVNLIDIDNFTNWEKC